jgi:N-methylhydantoinase B
MSVLDEREGVGPTVDPITFEVIRNKLQAISDEQAIALKAVSGSPVVTDATDFNTGLYLPDGSIVTMGRQVLIHSGTMSSIVRSVLDERGEEGLREGDMFVLNDPYRGAVHQPDVSIVAPIFWEGRLVAWAGACAHQIDVGGMTFSSWSYGATEIQQEAMLLPGLRIVQDGEILEDVWQTILGMSRLPFLLGLDLKAMIAANNVAIRRCHELMQRYGGNVVEGVMRDDLDASEQRMRARLRDLPDGIFRAVDFLDHDGHENRLYEFRLAVTKIGEELTFDLTGTSEQAPGFINCTRSGLRGALLTAVLPILAPDIRWNEGLMRPLRIVAPEGIVCNATWPAPVSGGTVSAIWVAMNVAAAALSRLAACGTSTRGESAAVTKGSMTVFTLAGRDRDGDPWGTFLLDSTAGGGGAYDDHDGLTASGDYTTPRPSIANVETLEASGPILYLYRRVLPDTAGAGRQRGGATIGVAITPYGTEELNALLIGHGVEVPNSVGLFGGLEGCCNQGYVAAVEDGRPAGRVSAPDDLVSPRVLGAKPGSFTLRRGEVFAYSFQGGGGYGDPLERDPALVAADVLDGLLTRPEAERTYGVVLHGDEVDGEATRARRLGIRAARLGRPPDRDPGNPSGWTPRIALGPSVGLDDDGVARCRCGHELATAGGNWVDGALTRVVDPAEHGPHVRLHEELELREHICPGCGTLLESEVARIGAPSLHTVEVRP